MSRIRQYTPLIALSAACAISLASGGCVAVVAGAAGAIVASGNGSPTEAAGDAIGAVADRAGQAVSAGIRAAGQSRLDRATQTVRVAERTGAVIKTAGDAVQQPPVLEEVH